jgi:hypothetical protein
MVRINLAAFGIGVALLSVAAEPTRSTDLAIIDAARMAMVARQQIGAVDATSTNPDENVTATVAPGHYTKAEGPRPRQLTEARVRTAVQVGRRRLSNFFTGEQLDRDLGYNAIQRVRNQSLVLTGGATNFEVSAVVLDEGGATVTGTATIWINTATVRREITDVSTIEGDVSFELHLVDVGDQWKVDSYDDDFLPGSGP